MLIDNTFKFSINVSLDSYIDKSKAQASLTAKGAKAVGLSRMSFSEKNLTINEFLKLTQKGHTFCGLFRPNKNQQYKIKTFWSSPYYSNGALKLDFKRDEFWSGTQAIFIDIDKTRFTDITDFLNQLTYKPSALYLSYSDNKDKGGLISRRFHLVYIFDELIDDVVIFKELSLRLSKQLEIDTNEALDDYCGSRPSQYMNGCYGADFVYSSGIIYSFSDIKAIFSPQILDTPKPEPDNQKTEIDWPSYLNDWDRLEIDEFKKEPSWIKALSTTKYIYRVEGPDWINDSYQLVSDDYFRLFYNVNQVKDGQGRRKDLFMRMCLRRIIKPSVTAQELVFCCVLDIIRQYDNSDGLLNSDFIKRNTERALEQNLIDIQSKYSGTIEYLKSLRPKKGIIYKNKACRSRLTTFCLLDDLYNPDLSVQANLEILQTDYQIPLKKTTIYDYLKSRGSLTKSNKLSDADLIEIIDFDKSATQNLKDIKALGFQIGKTRLLNIMKSNQKSYEENTKTN